MNDVNEIDLMKVEIENNSKSNVFFIEEDLKIMLSYKLNVNHDSVTTSIHLNSGGAKVFCTGEDSKKLEKGLYSVTYVIPESLLNNSFYTVDVFLIFNVTDIKCSKQDVVSFSMEEKNKRTEYLGEVAGVVRPIINSNNQRIS